jgi:hypothetical protein
LWFDKLNLSLKEDKYQGDISGEIFRGDAYQEGVGIDEFAEKIRSSSVVMSLFSGVDIKNVSRGKNDKYDITKFTLNLKD